MTQHRSPAKPPGTNGLYQPFSYKTRLTDLLRIKIIPGEPMARHADDLDEESFSLPSNRMQKAVLDEHMRRKGRAVMRIMGLFALCAGVGVAVSMGADSARSSKSERLLIQESRGNLKKITSSKGGGMQALAAFTHKIAKDVATGSFNQKQTPGKVQATKAALHAAAARKMAAVHARLAVATLAKTSKLGEEEPDAGAPVDAAEAAPEDASGEAAADTGSNSTAGSNSSAGSDDAAAKDDVPDDRYDETDQPGWSTSAWTTSDFVVWTITGPVLTMTAAMFIFYTYGWQWALPTLLFMVAVDMFAVYYNV